MEEASKALVMAAGVLIGVMVLTLAIYMFSYFGSALEEIMQKHADNKLLQFNTQFTIYENRELTIQDVVSIATLAKENNDYYDMPSRTSLDSSSLYVFVKLDNEWIHEDELSDHNSLIEEIVNDITITNAVIPKYKITEFEIDEGGTNRVYYIKIE